MINDLTMKQVQDISIIIEALIIIKFNLYKNALIKLGISKKKEVLKRSDIRIKEEKKFSKI